MIRRAVITGATGAIGMALIGKCKESGTEAVVLVNPNSKRIERIPDDPLVRIIKCGLKDFSAATPQTLGIDALEDGIFADAFFHLAWGGTFGDCRNDKALQDRNAEYALDAVRLAARLGCSVFVGAGSQAEYGRVSGILRADTACNPENEYGRAKLRASGETRKLAHELGIRHIWPRILSVYGPYDGEKTMVMSLISTLLEGARPSLTKGEQVWDYLYADDAADAMMLMAEYGRDGAVYPLGSGTARPLCEYVKIIRDLIDPKLELGFGEVPYSDRQVMHLCADISGLKQDTGFTQAFGFEEGAKRTIDYMKQIHRNKTEDADV